MTSTLWQSYHLAKEPFKKTLEKVEVLALVVLFFFVFFFLVGCGGKSGGDMLTAFSLPNK